MADKSPTTLFLQDGDRRWAKREGVSNEEGYLKMAEKIAFLIDELSFSGISKVYIPTNSIANLSRPTDQVEAFLSSYLKIQQYTDKKVKIVLRGNFEKLPEHFKAPYREVEKQTESNREFTLYLLLNWSFLDEVVRISNEIVNENETISSKSILKYSDIREPIDLIVRTGKRHRLSSFVPLSGEYAEIYFLDILFPDITKKDIQAALNSFYNRNRTFGS